MEDKTQKGLVSIAPMKILSFMSPVKFGGGERLMLDLGDYFKSEHISFSIINFNRSSEFEEKLVAHNIPFANLSNINFKQTPRKSDYLVLLARLLRCIPKTAKTIISESPDYVLANGFPPMFLVAAALWCWNNKPKMIYVHHSVKTRENWLIGFIYKLILNRYDKIVAVSSLTRDSLIESFPSLREKITFVSNGIDYKRFDIPDSKVSLRKKLGLPSGIIAISVGRLTRIKNQGVLIDLAKSMTHEDFHVLIAGDGDEYGNLSRAIQEGKLGDCITLLGGVDSEKLPYYLRAADMFLFPSLKEGFGIAVIEAMSAGLPVVILNSIYTEEFGDDLLVAKDDAEFKNMAMRLTKDEKLRNTIGSRAKKYIADHLDISITGKKFMEVIR